MKLDLSTQEATAIVQLIDLAVKAHGLQVAETAAILVAKINQGMREEAAPKAPSPLEGQIPTD